MTTSVVLCSPADDLLIQAISSAIERVNISLVVVGLDPNVADDAEHEERYRSALAEVEAAPVIGGFSLGARIAARLAAEVAPSGLLCFGFPFHSAKDRDELGGYETLSKVSVPTRIIQGTRDVHGSEAEVRGYHLPKRVEMVWLRDGNHRFMPRRRSGLTQREHIETAAAAAVSFIESR